MKAKNEERILKLKAIHFNNWLKEKIFDEDLLKCFRSVKNNEKNSKCYLQSINLIEIIRRNVIDEYSNSHSMRILPLVFIDFKNKECEFKFLFDNNDWISIKIYNSCVDIESNIANVKAKKESLLFDTYIHYFFYLYTDFYDKHPEMKMH